MSAHPLLLMLLGVAGSPPACDATPAPGSASSIATKLLAHSETGWIVSRQAVSSNTMVVTISEFLPSSVALHWHSMLNSTWKRSEPCRTTGTCVPGADGEGCSWLYTTNSHGGNQKIRSVFRKEARRQEVEAMYKKGSFAYSKWELTTSHSLYRLMGEMMESREVRRAIANVMWPDQSRGTRGLAAVEGGAAADDEKLGAISDYFVTAFDDGDFLSTHGDGASGSLAWVLHLAGHHGGWNPTAGGALRFNGGRVVKTARDFDPGFNKLLLFLTRPDFCPHQVLRVTHKEKGAEPRFGMTGWYMTAWDKFDAATKVQHDLMRAAASKASVSDQCL